MSGGAVQGRPVTVTVTDPLPRWRRAAVRLFLAGEAVIALLLLAVPPSRARSLAAAALVLGVVGMTTAWPRTVELPFPPGPEPDRGEG